LRPVSVQPSSACGGPNSDPSTEGCIQPALSPDGTKIVFARGLNVDVDGKIYYVNAGGGVLTQITNGPGDSSPDWAHPPSG